MNAHLFRAPSPTRCVGIGGAALKAPVKLGRIVSKKTRRSPLAPLPFILLLPRRQAALSKHSGLVAAAVSPTDLIVTSQKAAMKRLTKLLHAPAVIRRTRCHSILQPVRIRVSAHDPSLLAANPSLDAKSDGGEEFRASCCKDAPSRANLFGKHFRANAIYAQRIRSYIRSNNASHNSTYKDKMYKCKEHFKGMSSEVIKGIESWRIYI